MLTFSLRSGFLRKNSRLQGKKRSKIGHLASIFDAAGVDFYQKYRRKADCQHALRFNREIILNKPNLILSTHPVITRQKPFHVRERAVKQIGRIRNAQIRIMLKHKQVSQIP